MVETSVARGEATRRRLQDAAVRAITEVGWNSVTTRLVAERAGVNPALVHYHYASVSDLLVAASMGFVRELLNEVAQRLGDTPDVASGVDWLLDELTAYTGTDPASLLLVEAFLASSRLPHLRAQLAVVVAEFRTCVADWLRGNGIEDAEAAAVVLTAALDGLVLHGALDPALDISELSAPLRRLLGDA